MSRVVVSGYYGFGNFGDEAILQVLIENLKEINADITVISHNPEKTAQTHGVKTVYTYNIVGIINQINSCDVVISGGGSLLQDVTSLRSLMYYLFIIFWSILCCKRTIIFAQGIGPVNNRIARRITKSLLGRSSLITVRDERSQKLLKEWDIESTLVDDPVWGINLKKSVPKGKIGIQLREWKYMSDEFFLNLVRQVAADFSEHEIYIYSLQDKQDKEICMRFESYLHLENPSVKTKVFYDMNVNEITDSMRDLEYLVAMRYHAIMVGLKYGVNPLAINYDPKVETLAKFAKIPCVNFEEYKSFAVYFEKMKLLSRRSILLSANKKHFNFDIFKKEINKEI